MKKTFIAATLVFSALSFAQAEQDVVRGEAGAMIKIAMPMIGVTGDAQVDAQLEALRKEMDTKIEAIMDEYQVKIKAVVGDKKMIAPRPGMMGTTTVKEIRKEIKDDRKQYMEERKEMRVEGAASTSIALPRVQNQFFMSFFKNLFGRPQE